METSSKPASTWLFALKMGVLLGAVSILLTLILFATGLYTGGKNPASFIPVLVNAVMAFFMVKYYRDKQVGGFISFGSAFGLSVKGFLISGVIGSPFQYVFMNILHPTLIQKQFEMTRAQYVAQGLTDDQIEVPMKWMTTSMTNPSIFIAMGILGFAAFGAIIGLVVAAICKKEQSPFAPSTGGAQAGS